MITVYDENGKEFILESVDAREYLATGRFFTELQIKPEPVEVDDIEKPKQLTKPKKGAAKNAETDTGK